MELLSPLQHAILGQIGRVQDSAHFYLTGGTALAAFYLKHRRSEDLDFFTASEELIDPFTRHLADQLQHEGLLVKRQRVFQSFVELGIQQDQASTVVQVALDAAFRFEPTRVAAEYPGMQIDSLTDIASNKLLALFGRATLRDFIDVYWVVTKGGFTEARLIEYAKKKDPGFDLYWLGVAFERIKTFTESAPELSWLLQPVSLRELVAFFSKWREDLNRQLSG